MTKTMVVFKTTVNKLITIGVFPCQKSSPFACNAYWPLDNTIETVCFSSIAEGHYLNAKARDAKVVEKTLLKNHPEMVLAVRKRMPSEKERQAWLDAGNK